MQNISRTDAVPTNKTAVALGVFDGVHRGHQAVINSAIKMKDEGLPPAVFTFSTRTVTTKGNGQLDSILSDELKLDMFERMGVEYVYSPDFSKVRGMTAECFIKSVLVDKLNASVVVCGENFHFGKGAFAGSHELSEMAEKYSIKTIIVPFTLFNNSPISSTEIRARIKEGSIDIANFMLGYDFHFRLVVCHGNEIGRTINYPTINQRFPVGQVVPRFGVYASQTKIDDRIYMSVTNIGIKPTIGGEKSPLAETHIFDFSGNLYDREVTVALKKFIRPEMKFSGIEELKNSLGKDAEKAREFLDFKNLKGGFDNEQG